MRLDGESLLEDGETLSQMALRIEHERDVVHRLRNRRVRLAIDLNKTIKKLLSFQILNKGMKRLYLDFDLESTLKEIPGGVKVFRDHHEPSIVVVCRCDGLMIQAKDGCAHGDGLFVVLLKNLFKFW